MTDATHKEDQPSRTAVASAFAILLFAWLAVLWPLPKGLFKESDTYWLIEVGRNILHHFALPTTDPYSFASLRTPWIVYQWLTEVVLALANTFGLQGVAILGEVTLGLLLCVLIFRRMIRLGANSLVAFIVIAIVTHATYPDIATMRPQLFSFVFLFLLQTILEDVWSAGAVTTRNLRYVLAKTFAIGVLWANCHVSFPLGLVMLVIYLGGAAARVVVHKGGDKSTGADKSRLKTFAWMTVVFLGATFINPYGVGLWIFLKTLNNNYLTQEMQPLDWSRSRLYVIVYCLLLSSTVQLWKSAARPRVVLSVVLFAIGCLHARFIEYFCLSTCPLIGQAISAMLPNITRRKVIARLSDSIRVVAFKTYYPIAVIAVSIMVVCSQPLYTSKSAPLKAAEYLQSHKPAGNLFCSAAAGSYLIYEFDGSIKVFMDTRVDLYDAAVCRRYVAATMGSGWKELFGEYNIAVTLLPTTSSLNQAIEHDPNWKQIYQDDDFSISVR